MGIRRKVRELVVQVLYALTFTEQKPHFENFSYLSTYQAILADIAEQESITKDESIYMQTEISLKAILMNLESIDQMINYYIGEYKFEKIGFLDLVILRLAIYEMLFEKIPPPVIINEALEISKKFCAEKSPALINAILDTIKLKELYKNE